MSQNICRRIVAIAAAAMFVGCQTGMKSSASGQGRYAETAGTASDNAKGGRYSISALRTGQASQEAG